MVARGEPVGDADGGFSVGVVNGVETGSGVGVGVGVGVWVGVGVACGVGVGAGVGVGVGVGVKAASGVGVGVGACTGLPDGPQLTVSKPVTRRERPRKQFLRFRSIVKIFCQSAIDLSYFRQFRDAGIILRN
jgi:hypothetical protein